MDNQRKWTLAGLVVALTLTASCGDSPETIFSGAAPEGESESSTTVHPNARGLECLAGENISIVTFEGGEAAQPGPQARGTATAEEAVERYRQAEWPSSPRESRRRPNGSTAEQAEFELPDEEGRTRALLVATRVQSDWFVGGYRACADFEFSSRGRSGS